jgi:hypothetical protein
MSFVGDTKTSFWCSVVLLRFVIDADAAERRANICDMMSCRPMEESPITIDDGEFVCFPWKDDCSSHDTNRIPLKNAVAVELSNIPIGKMRKLGGLLHRAAEDMSAARTLRANWIETCRKLNVALVPSAVGIRSRSSSLLTMIFNVSPKVVANDYDDRYCVQASSTTTTPSSDCNCTCANCHGPSAMSRDEMVDMLLGMMNAQQQPPHNSM